MTFSPVVLYKTSNGSNLVSFFLLRATGVIRSSCSFCKEWPEWFAPVTLFVKSDRSNSIQSLFWKRSAGWFAPVPVPFLKEQGRAKEPRAKEWKSEREKERTKEQKSKRAKEQKSKEQRAKSERAKEQKVKEQKSEEQKSGRAKSEEGESERAKS